jgi:hypothetical protein
MDLFEQTLDHDADEADGRDGGATYHERENRSVEAESPEPESMHNDQ